MPQRFQLRTVVGMTSDLEQTIRQEHHLRPGSGWDTITLALAQAVTPTFADAQRLADATTARLGELGPVTDLDVHKVLRVMSEVHLEELVAMCKPTKYLLGVHQAINLVEEVKVRRSHRPLSEQVKRRMKAYRDADPAWNES